jgi:hypothetical protein
MANILRTKDISLFIFTSTVPRDEKCGHFVCWNKMCVLSVTEARNYKHLHVVINTVTYLHYAGHPLPRSDVTGDTMVTTQLWIALGSVP